MYTNLKAYIDRLSTDSIPIERKEILQQLVDYIHMRRIRKAPIRLNFICTHNSRRSHLCQVWAQAMGHYYDLDALQCYSAGTEATALFPMAAESLTVAGFQISTLSDGKNPIYAISYGENEHPIIGFSKTLDHAFNPKADFAAIMTCDSANEACPVVRGSEVRIPVTYEDPKAFDNSPQQSEKYQERCFQIANEMKFIFSNIPTS
ncbi:MAG: protein-tyrosine-phosphatase [Cyclobacteriaceae bacterium]|nr:protein-tyrosine-phosphatase [Cyclobacteriaceae bacterium]MCH8516487.1 protein-tyrosine-phosphatase [Cyclobacteriaceae bacterium]